jgi:hypothetical protein
VIAILSATWRSLRSSNNSQGFQILRINVLNTQGHQPGLLNTTKSKCALHTSLLHGTPHALPEAHKWSSLPLAQISEAGHFVVRFTQGLAKVWRSKRSTSPSIFQGEIFITTHRTTFTGSHVHFTPQQTSNRIKLQRQDFLDHVHMII